MRRFKNGETIWVEPFRAAAFPIVSDLVVDRSAFDYLIEAGGYIPVRTGSAPDANAIPIAKTAADLAMEAAACIGCGACVAACPNSSAMLFVAARSPASGYFPRASRTGAGASSAWYEKWTSCALAIAPTTMSARQFAPLRSAQHLFLD